MPARSRSETGSPATPTRYNNVPTARAQYIGAQYIGAPGRLEQAQAALVISARRHVTQQAAGEAAAARRGRGRDEREVVIGGSGRLCRNFCVRSLVTGGDLGWEGGG